MKTINKVLILATILLTSITLTSCSSDDDASGENPSIVGTWQLSASISEEFTNNVSNGVTEDTVDENNSLTLILNADGTFSSTATETYPNMGEEVTETYTDDGTYTVTGNTIFVKSNDDPETSEANFTLSSTQLTVVNTETYIDNNQDEKRFIDTLTFNRQ